MSGLGNETPDLHRHRCMRCDHTFTCRTPEMCSARYDVFPSIVTLGPSGPVITEHCQKAGDGWQPVEAFQRPLDTEAA